MTEKTPSNGPPSTMDGWKTRGQEYERITGGCTRRIAEMGLSRLPKLTSTSRILDSGAGPGVVTALILDKAREQGLDPLPSILATDFSAGMIEQLNVNKEALGWNTVESRVMDSQNLEGLEDNSFDAIFMNFALFALPDAAKGASEMLRVLKRGGVAIITTWREPHTVMVMEKACNAIRPQDVKRVLPISKDWLTEEKLRSSMVSGGFKNEKVDIWQESTEWKNDTVEDLVGALSAKFWEPIWRDWSEEDISRWRPEVSNALSDKERADCALEMHAWMCCAIKE